MVLQKAYLRFITQLHKFCVVHIATLCADAAGSLRHLHLQRAYRLQAALAPRRLLANAVTPTPCTRTTSTDQIARSFLFKTCDGQLPQRLLFLFLSEVVEHTSKRGVVLATPVHRSNYFRLQRVF